MAVRRILTVVVGDRCSLCDVALDRLRTPASLLGVKIVTETLAEGDHAEHYSTRVPVLLGPGGRVLAEGRVGGVAAWSAVVRVRFERFIGRDSGS